MLHIYIDADGCPVKNEVYRVAQRYSLNVTLVANSWMRHPDYSWLTLEVVKDLFDAADDWIVEKVAEDDIVIAGDIPLADRCIKAGAHVISPRGKLFTEDDIGSTLGTRDLMTHLRDIGEITGGPPPFSQRDRSSFLQKLDQVIQKIKRLEERRQRRKQ